MAQPKKHIAQAQAVLAAGKRVLFVEGKNDHAVYSAWLAKIDPLYAAQLAVVAVGGRNDLNHALPALGNPPGAWALRDRDELDTTRFSALQANAPHLLVNLGRHCLENYFCDPAEVEAALLAKDAAKYGPALPAFRAALEAALPAWVDNWAMWTTALRLQGDMVSAGYTNCFHDIVPLPPDADIQARLQTWSALSEAGTVWATFDGLRAAGRAAVPSAQFRSHVHGKNFWSKVVQPELLKIDTLTDWLFKLATWSPVPADIEAILRPLI